MDLLGTVKNIKYNTLVAASLQETQRISVPIFIYMSDKPTHQVFFSISITSDLST